MEATHGRPSVSEVDRARLGRAELVERIMRLVPADGAAEPVPGVVLRRATAPTELGHGVSYPCFCVIAEGGKEVLLGDRRYPYDPEHYLIATAALPIASRITAASPERPYLSVILRLDPALVGSVMVEAGRPAPRGQSAVTAIAVSPLGADLLEAVVRLVRLADTPGEARFLAPLMTREIVYRLLGGEQHARLAQITTLGGPTHRIAEAVERLRRDFAKPLHIEELAGDLGMSVSGFHHHFKALTALSPLQFQKQLRLQEARRLMLGDDLDAASAGYRVGYADASHFNREYKRQFGVPPMRHTEQLRDATWESAGV